MGKPLAGNAASTARAISTLPQLRRLLWAVGRLRAGRPLKATDLASEFEVNVRTAYRDLDFLRDDWRAPLEFDRAQATYRLTEPTVALPSVTLSEGELVALYFAEKVLAQYRGTPFEADLASAFGKIQELLPEEVKVSPQTIFEAGLDPATLDGQVFYEGKGCLECDGTGFHGRMAIAELLDLSDRIRGLILERRPAADIKKAAKEEGMTFLREAALAKVFEGSTTLKEINKVTFVD